MPKLVPPCHFGENQWWHRETLFVFSGWTETGIFFFEEKYPAKDKTKGLTIVIITKLDQLQIVSQKLFGLVDLNLVLRYPTTCDS